MAAGSRAILNFQSIVANERSAFNLPTVQIDAANLGTWLTQWGAFKTASDAIGLGVQRTEVIVLYDTQLSDALPASNFARRELKMLVKFHVDSTSLDDFEREFPMPDLAALTLETGDSNYVVLADGGVMAAWVTAVEAFVKHPDDHTVAATVQSARIVGRNI